MCLTKLFTNELTKKLRTMQWMCAVLVARNVQNMKPVQML